MNRAPRCQILTHFALTPDELPVYKPQSSALQVWKLNL